MILTYTASLWRLQKLVEILDNAKKVNTYDPYLDAPSNGEQDYSSEDEEEGQPP